MGDPLLEHGAVEECLRVVADEAVRYLREVDSAPVRPPDTSDRLPLALPDEGAGSLASIRALIEATEAGATRSAGPRFFHFVMGGGTPAALAADWLTSAVDQIAFNWVSSPFAMRLEQIAVGWLKELFGLPAAWSGVLTSGATTANFTGLAAARRWWGLQHGVDVEEEGLAGLPAMPVFGTEHVHVSALKALAMLGIGRRQVDRSMPPRWVSRPCSLATAGDVNTGAFDPLAELADLAAEHGAWLHVDGAFGLFAALSPLEQRARRGNRSSALGRRRRAQVAQRALRLRRRLRARSRAASRRVQCDRRVPRHAGARPAGLLATSRRRCRGERARSASGRRCTPTAATATARWSNGICNSRGGSPSRWTRSPSSSVSRTCR